jgi:hypothetical protein
LLVACSPDVTGVWVDQSGVVSYEFQRDGQVQIVALGSVVTGEYSLDGAKVVLTSPQGTVVLTRKGDRLIGPMGAEMLRRSDN